MRDPRQPHAKVRVEAAAMNAAFYAALMPLFVVMRHNVVGLVHFAPQYPDAVAFGLAGIAALPVMMLMRGLIRRLPTEDEVERRGSRRRLTKELAAALVVGYAVLTATGGLVVVFALDALLRGQRLGPAYEYFVAASICVGVAILAGIRCFRRARGAVNPLP